MQHLVITLAAVSVAGGLRVPQPYAFGYAAGRFPGHIDRTHSEVSDGAGTVQGSYSYVDPRHKVRTVEYVADAAGFRVLNGAEAAVPQETAAVAHARRTHLARFNQIALEHRNGGNSVPVDSVAVSRAKDKHFGLYRKIAEEHARLAAAADAENARNRGTEHPIY